jgi:hypothetical protein
MDLADIPFGGSAEYTPAPGAASAQTLHDANLNSSSQGWIPTRTLRSPFIRPPPGRYSTRSTRQAASGTRRRVSLSLRMRLASSLDALSGSCEDAECFMYRNTLIGRQLRFTLTSRIGKNYTASARQIARRSCRLREKTSSLPLVPLDFRYVRHRDRINH